MEKLTQGHTVETHERGIATYDASGRYRFTLHRFLFEENQLFGRAQRIINFLMLNPSTASAAQDDPTVRRCIGYAKAWGFTDLIVTNLFALRSTNPLKLYETPNPIGDGNDEAIINTARASALVVCAWGHHGAHMARGKTVAHMLTRHGANLHALAFTGARQPAHPLYLRKQLEAQPFIASFIASS